MNPWLYLLLLAGLVALWLVAERGYRDYETETAFGTAPGGIATIEFVAIGGRIVLLAVVGALVISAFQSHGWTTGVPALVVPFVGLVTYLLRHDAVT